MSDFPKHWKLLPLEDVMEAIIDYRGKTPKKTDEGIPLITAKIVKGGRILDPAEFIAESDYDSWMVRGLPEVGDVVVTSEAPLGEVAQLTDSNVALAQRIVTLRGKEGVLNNDFLLCAMQSNYVQHQLESRASGSTVKGIKQSELRKVLLPIPPEEEQIEIANHIKTLSKKIELNRQTNQTLEQIAQAIFKSWFVDFEPAKAKAQVRASVAQGKLPGSDQPLPKDFNVETAVELAAMCAISGKTEDQLKVLSDDALKQLKTTAALFPDALVESELGEIPEGWRYCFLEDADIEIEDGDRGKNYPNKTELLEIGFCPFLNNKNLIGDFLDLNSVDFISKEKDNKLRKGRALVGDIILTTRGSIGNVGVLLNEYGFAYVRINSGMIILKPNNKEYNNLYLYSLLKMPNAKEQIEQLSSGSVQKQLPIRDFKKYKVFTPNIKLQNIFGEYIGNAVKLKINEDTCLKNIRDALLPKLLSGGVIIDDIKAKAGVVA